MEQRARNSSMEPAGTAAENQVHSATAVPKDVSHRGASVLIRRLESTFFEL